MEFLGDNLIIAYVIGLVLLFFLIRIFYAPLKIAFKLLGNAIAGGVFLLFINVVGSIVNIQIGVNLATAIIAGILGIPGVTLMLILQVVLSV